MLMKLVGRTEYASINRHELPIHSAYPSPAPSLRDDSNYGEEELSPRCDSYTSPAPSEFPHYLKSSINFTVTDISQSTSPNAWFTSSNPLNTESYPHLNSPIS
ncbi:hypothetical protein ACMFMG_005913 [Clarireedia jacksonii]